MAGHLKVTLVKSAIGSKPKARGTIRALGLRRINSTNVLPDRPEIRGMLAKVPHLVSVEDAPGSGVSPDEEQQP
ncbi:MAG TPA: 50S ribosomal protein L30 [Acidimicrobiia bacterium]|nr:50S ribosomal protein L30 [Acidimicrobiia bacterium]